MTEIKGKTTAAIALCTAAAVIAGLVVSGGPLYARKENRDEARLANLRAISRNIECQAQQLGRIPEAPESNSTCPGKLVLTDPLSGEAYTYSRTNDRYWRVCATFELPDQIGQYVDLNSFDAEAGCLIGRYPYDLPPQPPLPVIVAPSSG